MATIVAYQLENDETIDVAPRGDGGRVEIRYDGEVIPLLDEAVRELGELLIQIADDRGI